MTYTSDIRAEADWNRESAAPGHPPICRKHYAFRKGQEAYQDGTASKSPYLAGGEADRHWHAGWKDAAQVSRALV